MMYKAAQESGEFPGEPDSQYSSLTFERTNDANSPCRSRDNFIRVAAMSRTVDMLGTGSCSSSWPIPPRYPGDDGDVE